MNTPKPQPSPEPSAHSRSQSQSRPGLFKRTPRDFLDMFTERWWIGAIVGTIAAALIVIFRPQFEPLYRTQASLLFETRNTSVVDLRPVVQTNLTSTGELATYIEQLKSNSFASVVMGSFSPDEIKIIQQKYLDPEHPGAAPSVGEIVRPNVSVNPRRGSPILDISVTHRDPEAARLIADRYAQKFMDYRADNATTVTTTGMLSLRNQAQEARELLDAAQILALDYRDKYKLASLSQSQTAFEQELNLLTGSLGKAAKDQLEQKAQIDAIEEYARADRDLQQLPQIAEYGNVSGFDKAVKDLKAQRLLLLEDLDVENPKVKSLDAQIAVNDQRLKDAIKDARADLESRFNQSQELVRRLEAQYNTKLEEARKLDRISTEYKALESDVAEKTKTLNYLNSRLSELKVATQMQDANVTFLDHAWVPGAPADRGIASVALKAASAGFGLLIFIPLALGLFDTRIRTPLHIEEGLQEPLLGAVKRMKKMGETQRAQVFRLQKEKDLAESYLGIFSEMEVRSALGFPKTLLITSSVPAEGKSLLCSNLAAVFASHKRRTLLVDCDLRRPTLHRYFGVKVDTGWVQWLETPAATRPASPLGIVAVSEELHLLPAGRAPGNPTELLDRLSRRETLQPLLQNYDIVIFDTPPAAVFPDALLLARSCHEMIYVCRYRTVRLSVVRKVLDRFRDSGISTLGVVLNQLPETKARNYGYHGYGMQSADYYKAYADKPEA